MHIITVHRPKKIKLTHNPPKHTHTLYKAKRRKTGTVECKENDTCIDTHVQNYLYIPQNDDIQ